MSCVREWTTDECAQFFDECASKVPSPIKSERLEEYKESFRQNCITGINLANQEDLSWSHLIVAIGFRGAVVQMLQETLGGEFHFSNFVFYH